MLSVYSICIWFILYLVYTVFDLYYILFVLYFYILLYPFSAAFTGRKIFTLKIPSSALKTA